MSDDKGWTMLAGDDADASEVDRLRLSLLTMAARERETAAERDALRVMLAETCEALRALLAAEREKTEQSIPMKSILAARDLFDIGTHEYEAIDDIIAGRWGLGE